MAIRQGGVKSKKDVFLHHSYVTSYIRPRAAMDCTKADGVRISVLPYVICFEFDELGAMLLELVVDREMYSCRLDRKSVVRERV